MTQCNTSYFIATTTINTSTAINQSMLLNIALMGASPNPYLQHFMPNVIHYSLHSDFPLIRMYVNRTFRTSYTLVFPWYEYCFSGYLCSFFPHFLLFFLSLPSVLFLFQCIWVAGLRMFCLYPVRWHGIALSTFLLLHCDVVSVAVM